MTIADDLIRDEGVVLHAYQDTLGLWTIGCGRMIDARRNGGISVDEARLLLANDLKAAEGELDLHCPWWREMTQRRQDALLNMTFNLGWPRLSGFQKMLNALADGDYATAAAEALASAWATQVGQRAIRIAELMKEG